jgi:hypothetical protein
MNILVPIVLVLLVVLFFKVRLSTSDSAKTSRSKKERKYKPSHKRIPDKLTFGCVSIEFSGEACPAVRKLEGQKFLEMEAPITPLSECARSKCRCRYVHYNDRRSPDERRNPLERGGRPPEVQSSGDRRAKHERRGVDSTINPKDHGYKELLNAAAEQQT